MRVSLSGAHVMVTDRLRAYVEYRLFTSAARDAAIVRNADVFVGRESRAHARFVCTIRLDVGSSGRIRTQARGTHPVAAIDRAAERAAWLLDRRVRTAGLQGEIGPFSS